MSNDPTTSGGSESVHENSALVPAATDANQPRTDPLRQVGQAMITAASAVRQGAGDARDKARQLAPAVTQSVSKAVYATCYYFSYGVVFPTVFVANLLPMDNAVGYGIIDGATAAKEAVARMHARRRARRAASQAQPHAEAEGNLAIQGA